MWDWSTCRSTEVRWVSRAARANAFVWPHKLVRNWWMYCIFSMSPVSDFINAITFVWFVRSRSCGILVTRLLWLSTTKIWCWLPIMWLTWGPKPVGWEERLYFRVRLRRCLKQIRWLPDTSMEKRRLRSLPNEEKEMENHCGSKEHAETILKTWRLSFLWVNWFVLREYLEVASRLWLMKPCSPFFRKNSIILFRIRWNMNR